MSPDQTPQPRDITCTTSVPVGPHAAAQDWPDELLDAYCVRMSSLGMCVSRSLMRHDHRYGLEQLSHADNMADDTLRKMAVQLLQHVQGSQPAVSGVH